MKRDALCLYKDGYEFEHALYGTIIMFVTGIFIFFSYGGIIVYVLRMRRKLGQLGISIKKERKLMMVKRFFLFVVCYIIFWTGFILLAWIEWVRNRPVQYGVWIFFLVLPHMQGLANAILYSYAHRLWVDWFFFLILFQERTRRLVLICRKREDESTESPTSTQNLTRVISQIKNEIPGLKKKEEG